MHDAETANRNCGKFTNVNFTVFKIPISMFQVVKVRISNFLVPNWQCYNSKLHLSKLHIQNSYFRLFLKITYSDPIEHQHFNIHKIHKDKQLGTHTFQSFQSFRFSDMKRICFKDDPIPFLYFFEVFLGNNLKTPKHNKYINKQRTRKKRFFFAVCWALLDPRFWALLGPLPSNVV